MFAAQFSLSHACYLIGYPTAGWLGASLGLPAAALLLAFLAAVSGAMAWALARVRQP